MKRFLSSILEVVEIALIAVVSVFLIRSFLIQPFLVSGDSMSPNFSNGDYLLVDELTYKFRSPERGEVVVFRYPQDESTYFIKRIIGLPGETVKISSDQVSVFETQGDKEIPLDERDYLPLETITSGNETVALGENQYFVLGDNRSYSFDSRSWGILEFDEIVGVARIRLWPINSLKAFAAPNY